MKKILQAISIIVTTLLAIFLVQAFNIFEYVPIVPVEIVQETGLTAYISILELVRGWMFEWIEKVMSENQSSVTCVFSIKGDRADATHNPIIEVKDGNSVRSVDISINIKAKKGKSITGKIEVEFPDWVDVQNVNRDTKSHVQGRKWYVDLNDVIGNCREDVNLNRIYTISIIKNMSDDGLSDSVKFSYEKKKISNVRYVTNGLTIKNVQ